MLIMIIRNMLIDLIMIFNIDKSDNITDANY